MASRISDGKDSEASSAANFDVSVTTVAGKGSGEGRGRGVLIQRCLRALGFEALQALRAGYAASGAWCAHATMVSKASGSRSKKLRGQACGTTGSDVKCYSAAMTIVLLVGTAQGGCT